LPTGANSLDGRAGLSFVTRDDLQFMVSLLLLYYYDDAVRQYESLLSLKIDRDGALWSTKGSEQFIIGAAGTA
jgi:hypothetical protein